MEKILDIENDGVNMAIDEQHLFIRCNRDIIKFSLLSNKIEAKTALFSKDGKARYLTISNSYVCVLDFCEVYVLNKKDLSVVLHKKIGRDTSTDLVAARCDDINVYISVRNGIIGVLNIATDNFSQYELCDGTSWEFALDDSLLYVGTVNGILYAINKTNLTVNSQCKLSNKNIYGVAIDNNFAYTISQDGKIKVVDLNTFEVVKCVNNAVKSMCRILGVNDKYLIVADQGISLWDKVNLRKINQLPMPTGHFNKGACYNGGYLVGSDYHSLYVTQL